MGALHLTNSLLQINPNHQLAHGNKLFYEKELKESRYEAKLRGDDGSHNVPKDDIHVSVMKPVE
jgi:prolyl 4-hydroxylase